jgi:uncharacterized tellurite resistance protein B-like protein
VLSANRKFMQQQETLLQNYSDEEKGAYLGAIASIATADRQASEEELEYITALADSAELSEAQRGAVIQAANGLSSEDLKRCLDILKGSELRFSLITDMISFAEADQDYSAEEKASVEKIAQYLGVNQQQFAVLDQFVKKTNNANVTPEQVQQPGFLDSLGLGDKMRSAGINSNTLMRTVLGIAGPMVLASMFRRRGGGGMLGGGMMGGGLGSGMGGMLGGGMMGGGLGSIIGMLGGRRGGLGGMLGGRGGGGGLGGMLGGMLGGRGGF